MYIFCEAMTPHGAPATTHRLKGVEISDSVRVLVNSFATPEAEMLVWQDVYEMPVLEMSKGVYPECVYNWMVSATGPFPGGQILQDPSDLELKKAKLRSALKTKRDAMISGGCATPAGEVDTDEVSLRNIMATYQSAVLALVTQNPYSVSWRLKDNSLVTLDAQAMIGLGNAVLQRIEAVYQHSWTLKEEIEAALPETIDAIDVSSGWPE